MASVTKFLKFPIFRKVDVFTVKNDKFRKTRHYFYPPFLWNQRMKVDGFKETKVKLNSWFLGNRLCEKMAKFGYIDVGDGCWRPNVLVTRFRCWWPIQDVGDRFNTLRKSPTLRKKSPREWFCHQHLKSVTIIKSPT